MEDTSMRESWTEAERAYAWYTHPEVVDGASLGVARSLMWLVDIEAAVVATRITLNCCSKSNLIDRAKEYVIAHSAEFPEDASAVALSERLRRLLEELHDHPRGRSS
jgi:hypothetical protein